ncbi:nuclear transport factor 2 family protein [Brevifollis gellanilyticus]|uniref:SnoaL-like domain-containing protein n=1 Tax=Brevifollis gellanilyticus TaxID=748831 RepID=A0A512MHA0_9BACT|nr:nuclear transport factor 2 family protein [Brevifollis gellanilyticus]GEP46099.1 hypothetical protein BGE01nite_53900 [Brevifollis gellanilyticus]
MKSPKQVLTEWAAAYNACDPHALAALYHDDAESHQVALGDPVRGKAALLESFIGFFRAFPDNFTHPQNIFEDGEWAIIEWHGGGTFTGPLGETHPQAAPSRCVAAASSASSMARSPSSAAILIATLGSARLVFRFLDSWEGSMPSLSVAMNSPLDRSERPRQVLFAVRLLYASLGVGFLKIGIEASALTKIHSADRLVFLTLVIFVIMALFFALIGMGKNWARILFLVSFLVGIPFWPGNMADAFRFSAFSGSLHVVQAGLQLWALILLFQSDSSAWFRRPSAWRAAALADG